MCQYFKFNDIFDVSGGFRPPFQPSQSELHDFRNNRRKLSVRRLTVRRANDRKRIGMTQLESIVLPHFRCTASTYLQTVISTGSKCWFESEMGRKERISPVEETVSLTLFVRVPCNCQRSDRRAT